MTARPAPQPLTERSLHLEDLGELIAGIPSMIGFPPVDSLVLLTGSRADRLQVGTVIRVDLPEPRGGPDLVSQLCLAVTANDVVSVLPVVVGGGTADPPGLPYRWLVELLARELGDVGVVLVHPVWVPAVERGETWWCFENPECTGQIRDPRSAVLAAMNTAEGHITYESREAMAANLAPDPEDRVAHRAQLLADRVTAPDQDPLDQWRMVREAIQSTATELPELDHDQIVRLAEALRSPLVRDNCIAALLTDLADTADRLWTVLTRAVPAPERAEPACLLAMNAYLRGEGVLANVALETALEADPDHEMATLLRQAIDRCMPPKDFRAMLTDSVAAADLVYSEAEAME